jgi:hypothetical protein
MTTTANVMTVHDNFMNLTLHDLFQKQKAIMQDIQDIQKSNPQGWG